MTETTAETAGPLPAGVLGYAVACIAARASLTHSTLLDRETAEQEAAEWRRAAIKGAGGRYVVCEVREAET